MAEITTIARPYAEAVFKLAREQGKLPQWSDTLELLATVVAHPEMAALVGNPRLTHQQVVELVVSVCRDQLPAEAVQLLKVMAENKRLSVLPQVHQRYEALRYESEGVLDAEITSAFPLAEKEVAAISESLSAKLGKRVKATSQVDQSLIGGVKIAVGDWVVDGSVRARLDQMAVALTS
jgi:F-type H+-transporting ATPase subunit delta